MPHALCSVPHAAMHHALCVVQCAPAHESISQYMPHAAITMSPYLIHASWSHVVMPLAPHLTLLHAPYLTLLHAPHLTLLHAPCTTLLHAPCPTLGQDPLRVLRGVRLMVEHQVGVEGEDSSKSRSSREAYSTWEGMKRYAHLCSFDNKRGWTGGRGQRRGKGGEERGQGGADWWRA